MVSVNISLSDSVKLKLPGIKLGLLLAGGVEVEKSWPGFDEKFTALSQDLNEKFADRAPSQDEVVAAVRRLYYRIGWEPTRYRPSSEALIRRVLKGQGLYRINNLVDLGNLTSARYHLPMGLYDFDKIHGDILLDVGRQDESYRGISKERIGAEGKLILRDEQGIFGNPTADSQRTSIIPQTKIVLAVFFCPQEVSDMLLKDTLHELSVFYRPYIKGKMEQEIRKFDS